MLELQQLQRGDRSTGGGDMRDASLTAIPRTKPVLGSHDLRLPSLGLKSQSPARAS